MISESILSPFQAMRQGTSTRQRSEIRRSSESKIPMGLQTITLQAVKIPKGSKDRMRVPAGAGRYFRSPEIETSQRLRFDLFHFVIQ